MSTVQVSYVISKLPGDPLVWEENGIATQVLYMGRVMGESTALSWRPCNSGRELERGSVCMNGRNSTGDEDGFKKQNDTIGSLS